MSYLICILININVNIINERKTVEKFNGGLVEQNDLCRCLVCGLWLDVPTSFFVFLENNSFLRGLNLVPRSTSPYLQKLLFIFII